MTEIKNRGGNDVLIAIVDGLKGFPEVINAVLSETQIQTYIVHLIHKNNEAETIIPPTTLTWLRALRSRADRTVKPGRSCEPIALESEILNEID
jgi:transposase-like protein